jgi:hypothetical protein
LSLGIYPKAILRSENVPALVESALAAYRFEPWDLSQGDFEIGKRAGVGLVCFSRLELFS